MKQKILPLAKQFENVYYNSDITSDERREQWKECVVELFHLMHSGDEQFHKDLYVIWDSSQCSNEPLVINALKWYAETFRPTFKHDCDKCTYYGTKTVNGQVYDFYICQETVIGRYSDECHENLTWSLPNVDTHDILKHVKEFMPESI
jgi:hypothetical protein